MFMCTSSAPQQQQHDRDGRSVAHTVAVLAAMCERYSFVMVMDVIVSIPNGTKPSSDDTPVDQLTRRIGEGEVGYR